MFGISNWVWLEDWSGDDAERPQIVLFRKRLWLSGVPEASPIRISADSRYRFQVNGVQVAFGPCKGDRFTWFEEEVDIAPFCRNGANVLTVEVLRYPLGTRRGNESVWRTDLPGLHVTGCVNQANGARLDLSTDKTWKAKRDTRVHFVPEGGLNFLWILEDAAGDAALKDWMQNEFDDTEWESAVAYPGFNVPGSMSPGALHPRPIPMMIEIPRRFSGLSCVRRSALTEAEWSAWLQGGSSLVIPPHAVERVEIDAGELMTGFLELLVRQGAGAVITLLSSECYGYPPEPSAGRFAMPGKGDRTDWRNGVLTGQTDTYRVGGYGRGKHPETYEPFWFRTFRYIAIEISTGEVPLELLDFKYRETGYPLEVLASVETSDETFRQIWDISLRTLRRCMHETYEDCPFYEQLQYAMDTRAQILFTYSVSGDDRLARKCMDDFHRSLRPDGLINCCAPSYGPNVIPGFSLYYLMMLHDHMMYFGDRSFLLKYLPTMDAILGFFERHRKADGMVGSVGGPLGSAFWSFVDWTPEWNTTFGSPTAAQGGPLVYENLLYAHVLNLSAEVNEYLDRPEQAESYRHRSALVREAVRSSCIGRDGLFQDGPGIEAYSQHVQVMAVLSGTVLGDEARQLIERTLEDKTLVQCSVAMTHYLFRAVEETGLYERTGALWQPWYDMVANHLTTCVEDLVSSRSDCHAWGAIALYEFPAVILGVRPVKPGYAEFIIQPAAGPFTWAKGSVPTPYGLVVVEWEMSNGVMETKIQVPPTAILRQDSGKTRYVREE